MRTEQEVRDMLAKVKEEERKSTFFTGNLDIYYGLKQALAWVLGDLELKSERANVE